MLSAGRALQNTGGEEENIEKQGKGKKYKLNYKGKGKMGRQLCDTPSRQVSVGDRE